MSAISDFLVVVDAYCRARDISEARASTLILNGGGRIGAIRSGASDVGSRTLDRAMQWLSDNWPDSPWPEGITRPTPSAQVDGAGDQRAEKAV